MKKWDVVYFSSQYGSVNAYGTDVFTLDIYATKSCVLFLVLSFVKKQIWRVSWPKYTCSM